MDDPPRYPLPREDSDVPPALQQPTAMPRWASLLGLIAAIGVVLLILILHLAGGFSPGSH
jgi:hypothetical protein